jgi:Ca2+-binding EF-hand superfamily protein
MALREEMRSEIGQVFKMFDEDDTGSIDVSELASALQTITGEKVSREDMMAIMAKFDADGSGSIDLVEFETMVLERMRGRSFQEETAKAFAYLEDRSMPGFVTRESVRKAADEIGEKLTDVELNEMFDVLVTGQTSQAIDFATYCTVQQAAEDSKHQLS